MMDAHNVKRSRVKMLNAVSPNTFNGIGVVPPVPRTINKEIDNPKQMYLLL